MAGVKGRSGGARPGAGAKKKSTEEQQQANRDLVLSIVTDQDLIDVTRTALVQSKDGDQAARNWISSYCLGNPKNEHDVNIKGAVTIVLPERKKAEPA